MKPYYDHAGIAIYHADCRDILPALSADVLVTDPPYGVDLGEYNGATGTRSGFMRKTGYASYDDTTDNFESIVLPGIELALSRVSRRVHEHEAVSEITTVVLDRLRV